MFCYVLPSISIVNNTVSPINNSILWQKRVFIGLLFSSLPDRISDLYRSINVHPPRFKPESIFSCFTNITTWSQGTVYIIETVQSTDPCTHPRSDYIRSHLFNFTNHKLIDKLSFKVLVMYIYSEKLLNPTK